MKSVLFKTLSLVLVLSQASLGQSPVPSRIERVEKGLLPAVLVKGEPGWTIEERLKQPRLPA